MNPEHRFNPEIGPMSMQELKEHAKNANVLNMELYVTDPAYRSAMEDENPWIHRALQSEQEHLVGSLLADSKIGLAGKQQESLKSVCGRFILNANQRFREYASKAPKEKRPYLLRVALEGARARLTHEPREILEDEERLEEFLESPGSKEEIEKFAQARDFHFDKYMSSRLYRILMRAYNPHFQKISQSENILTVAYVLERRRPLALPPTK